MSQKGDIESRPMGNQLSLRQENVRKKQQVMDRIINVVKVIGKRGLSYQGSDFEAAYTLEHRSLDHGNFLEMIMLLGLYDPCLQQHLTECIEKSKALHESGAGGRGSLVTLLSKDTIIIIISYPSFNQIKLIDI